MPCVVIVQYYVYGAKGDTMIKQMKRRMKEHDEGHPSFSRELHDFLNLSGRKLRKKKGPDGWTTIRAGKTEVMYWKYKIAGIEDAELDTYDRDLVVESLTAKNC
jgi:hypothetical protein